MLSKVSITKNITRNKKMLTLTNITSSCEGYHDYLASAGLKLMAQILWSDDLRHLQPHAIYSIYEEDCIVHC